MIVCERVLFVFDVFGIYLFVVLAVVLLCMFMLPVLRFGYLFFVSLWVLVILVLGVWFDVFVILVFV